MSDDFDIEFIESIAPDVIKVLVRRGFFEQLDDLLCPIDQTILLERCTGGYKLSERILVNCQFDEEERREIIAVLHSAGGCCDCEIL